MNIFVLNENPIKSAQQMVDKHVVKMLVESLQMISTCLHLRGFNAPYRMSFAYHPCTIWARESSQNMEWLVEHTYALCKEYTIRYGKTHQVERTMKMYHDTIQELIEYLPDEGLTPFAQAMPDMSKCDNACEAYQKYYLGEKWYFAEWKTQRPDWWPEDHIMKMRGK